MSQSNQWLLILCLFCVLVTQTIRCPYLSAKQTAIKQQQKQREDSIRLEKHRLHARIALQRSRDAITRNYYVTRNNEPVIGADTKYALVDSVLFYNDKPKLLSIDKDTQNLVAKYGDWTVLYKVVAN